MDDKMGTYESVFRASVDDPEAFWLDAAEAIDWQTPPTRALDASGLRSTAGSPTGS